MSVGFGHMRRDGAMAPFEEGAWVTGHSCAMMEDFDHLGRQSHLELVFDQRVGHGIVMTLDFHVVVDIDADAFPLRVFLRVGGQWP